MAAPRGPSRRWVGLQSGTSCDGVDAVVCELSGDEVGLTATLLSQVARPYEPELARRLLDVGDARAPELARLHLLLGRRFGEVAREALAAADLTPAAVVGVASPGHTAVHLTPRPGDPGATLVLGDGDVVAEVSGCLVVCEPRARDRAVGGQGAPLVPFADACLLRRSDRTVAALNLGGIANLTIVPPTGPPRAFDTGPANMALDGALRRATGGRVAFDDGGRLGLGGRVDREWLERALAEDGFVAQAPPKSTGRERYGDLFLEAHWPRLGTLPLDDLAATLAAFTVETVALQLERFGGGAVAELIVSGGGAANACLVEGLAQRLPRTRVRVSDQALGVPASAREALAFAVLADATLRGVPCNVPGVTGAERAVRLGKLCLPPTGGVALPPCDR